MEALVVKNRNSSITLGSLQWCLDMVRICLVPYSCCSCYHCGLGAPFLEHASYEEEMLKFS